MREERGKVIPTMSKTRIGLFEPAIGEALASFHAANLCRDLGIQQVWLEGDAKIIVDALNLNTSTWSRFGHIVEDTRCMLNTIPKCRCGFVHREANEATHRLAKAVSTNVSDGFGGTIPQIVLVMLF